MSAKKVKSHKSKVTSKKINSVSRRRFGGAGRRGHGLVARQARRVHSDAGDHDLVLGALDPNPDDEVWGVAGKRAAFPAPGRLFRRGLSH